ncbi:type I polyketide synthase [Bosea sp. 124]|uniref:type I polyketide synthase n=1 Tax=Bosea sp. 124 TaxID=2135642 RepID=UPI000D3830AD|nr:type I polyketide synthase [Bosea sp. 124]PTM41465.1 acyl transferase domain-containing protein [Bosea sp. 124]
MDQNDIAIIGMAVRAPGARSLSEFWDNLVSGRESIETLSEEALLAAGEEPARMRNSHYVPRAAPLPAMEMFDAEFFGVSPKEAAIMDPQHRNFLECAWEAFENSTRMPDSFEGPVGVFAGCGMGSYFYFNVCSNRQLVDQVGMFLLRHTGNDKDFLSTRVSYLFDLRGPSVNVQTACSSSLVAVHYACQSLLSGESDMALAGGVTIEFPHRRGYIYQDGEILSPDGHCRAFDHRAAGTVFGSGVGTVVLRRLADAIRDGDPIHAVIKATAVNNDGASKAGYLAPSVTGQAAAIIEAQALAGISADQVGYVECHGTGTYLGDPIEVEALTQAFRRSSTSRGFCRIGSVKTNIGHTDTAAGVIGLIKAAMTVKSGLIPPTLGYEKPNPTINFAESPFLVNDALHDWQPQNGLRIAAVNSLGVGGTNAHAIIQSPPAIAAAQAAGERDDQPALLVLSARNKHSLDEAAKRLADALESDPALSLTDASFTLFAGRKHFESRRIIPVSGRHDAIAICRDSSSRRGSSRRALEGAAQAAFVFPGGGAQHAGMARALYRKDERFRAIVDEGLGYLTADAAQEIRSAWFATTPDQASTLQRPSIQLPAILIVEIAMARLWIDWGLKPSVLIGHSMGENAAACISGVFSFRDAVNLVRIRGELFDEVSGGGMLSVPLSESDLKAHLPPQLDIASVNAPQLCVVSGTKVELHRFAEQLAALGIDSQPVAIDIAAHSRMLEPILGRFEAFVRSIPLRSPSIPIVSNLTAEMLTADQARDPTYWVRHLRSTVRFAEGISRIADPQRVFIEVGPGKTLSSLIKAQGSVDQNQIVNSLPHADEPVDDHIHLLGALGAAWALGLPVDMTRLWSKGSARRVALPSYAFRQQPYFIEPVAASAQPSQDELPRKLEDLAEWGYGVTWTQSVPAVRVGVGPVKTSWLIFMDDAGLGRELSVRLKSLGHDVVAVAVGDSFRRLDQTNYVLCPEDGQEGFDSLLGHLAADGCLPDHIVNLWLYTADEAHRPGSSFFHQNQERGFYTLFHLARALSQADITNDIALTVITNGMQRVGDENVRYPGKSTVLGAVLVLPKEYENLSVRAIDLPYDGAASKARRLGLKSLALALSGDKRAMPDWFDLLWDDLTTAARGPAAEASSEVVAYRKGRRWLHGFDKIRLDAAEADKSPFKTNGVYLITGGLGDLALTFAQGLAERFQARLVLVGRMKLPPRETWSTFEAESLRMGRVARAIRAIHAIENAGGKAVYMQGDVTNIDEMRHVVTETETVFGVLDGVLHTAGVIKDNLVEMKSTADLETVLAPKVYGTEVLNEALGDRKLDIVVLFSSTSAATAPAGQIDYVAANAYLNAVAQSDAMRAHRRVLALQWGVWNEIGLAAREIDSSVRRDDSDVVAVAQPLIDFRRSEPNGSVRLELTCGPGSHWILDQHRLKSGEAVWPGTGYVELLIQAARELGFAGAIELEQLSFLAPLPIADDETRSVVIQIAPAGAGRLSATVHSESDDGARQVHAEATIVQAAPVSPAALDVQAIIERSHSSDESAVGGKLRSAQEEHLRFGPRWSVLTAIRHGVGEKLAELELDEAFKGDLEAGYLAHPALLDIATGFAMGLIDDYNPAESLWVPAGYGQIRYHGPLPQRILSWARIQPGQDLGDDYATFDIVIARPDGSVLMEASDFTIRRVGKSFAAAGAAERRPAIEHVHGMKRAKPAQDNLSPAQQQLAQLVDQGIRPAEGLEAFFRAIATDLPQVVVSSMDLHMLMKPVRHNEPAAAPDGGFERPEGDVDYAEPAAGIETTLAGFWTQLLGVKRIGANDNFFDLGGHSLIAVRLFRMIKAEYAVDFPISVLFEAPTIAKCAALLEQSGVTTNTADAADTARPRPAIVATRYTHLVPMSGGPASGGRPFFICAGMFGNILNLRHLALHIGQDRPVYGLQAKGLFGSESPHETFEEMARDYLAEMRAVQPVGPYSIGGFSGGGMVAYEIAQQLEKAGESASVVILLDTPLPQRVTLSLPDRLSMKLQDARRQKGSFVANWIKSRIAWEMELRRKRKGGNTAAADQFHNAVIEAAFLRALWAYQVKPIRTDCLLLRPKLDVRYKISAGRELNDVRNLVSKDNGWTPYIDKLTITEVPGNHDSMVLEPHVRVVAEHMRTALRHADMTLPQLLRAAE